MSEVLSQNPFVNFLAQLDALSVHEHTMQSALQKLLRQQKRREADSIFRKGLTPIINALHAQEVGYDRILMELGLTESEANALIRVNDLYHPNLILLRDWCLQQLRHGKTVIRLRDIYGHIAEIAVIGDLGKSYQRKTIDGVVVSLLKTKPRKTDLKWLETESWWDESDILDLPRY